MEKDGAAAGLTQEELLARLLSGQEKEARHARITSAASIALIVMILVVLVTLVPRAVSLIDHLQTSLDAVDALVTEAGSLIEETSGDFTRLADSASELIGNANTMITDNTDAVTETVRKLNEVDFDKLNKAIADLESAVEPLANLANLFRR